MFYASSISRTCDKLLLLHRLPPVHPLSFSWDGKLPSSMTAWETELPFQVERQFPCLLLWHLWQCFLITSIQDKDFTLCLCKLRGEHKTCSAYVCKRKGRRKEVSGRWRKGRVRSCDHTFSPLFCTVLSALSYGPVLPLFQRWPNMRWCLNSGDCSTEWERERAWKKLERDDQ